ncbi:MAG: MFS transporter [Promethearchaeota archaeon]
MADDQATSGTETEHVPFWTKLAYSSGQIPGSFFGAFMGQIQAFYYGWMGLNWLLIVVAQVVYGAWNMLNDPIFGVLQDRTKHKNGRYIPWIKRCAPLFTVAFIVVFLPPQHWRYSEGGEQYQWLLFAWYLVSQVAYDTFFTIVFIAHVALLPQMTMDEGERTQIAALSSVMGLVGVALSSGFPLIFLTDPNAPKIAAFQVAVVVFGVVGFLPWVWIWTTVKEKQEYIPEEDTPFWESVKCVFRNPSGRIYIIYDGVSVGILNFIMTGITFFATWTLGLNADYQARHPGWDLWSLVPYAVGPVACFVVGLWVEFQIPKKYDIKTALTYSLACEAVGFSIAFIGALPDFSLDPGTYELPPNLWLLSLGLSIAMLGFTGDFIYHNPMRADTIDYDEVTTGERRESVYAGIGCVLSKPMISVALASVTSILAAFGLLAPGRGVESQTALVPTQGYSQALLGVAVATLLVPAILAALGLVAWHFYPLDRAALAVQRVKLERIHSKKREERLDADGSSKFVK